MKQNFIIITISLLFLTGCAKKKTTNSTLAKNYFQQSLIAAERNKREALVLIDQSLNIDPTPRAYALKATLLYQIGEYQDSLKLFEKVINEKSASATLKTDVYNNYACNLIMVGDTAKAKQTWLELANNRHYLSPEVAWFNLGLLECSSVAEKKELTKAEKNKLELALSYFRKATKINNDYIDCYYYISLTLIRLNQLEQAKQELIHVVGIMPEHQNAQNLLVYIDKLKQQVQKNTNKIPKKHVPKKTLSGC